jgi:hypothetical protein
MTTKNTAEDFAMLEEMYKLPVPALYDALAERLYNSGYMDEGMTLEGVKTMLMTMGEDAVRSQMVGALGEAKAIAAAQDLLQ